jgi:hypothetical protein
MSTLSKEDFELQRNLFNYLVALNYTQSEILNRAKENLKISKELNDEVFVKGWKREIKFVKNRLKFIDIQMGQFPIYIDSTYSDYLKIVKPSNK